MNATTNAKCSLFKKNKNELICIIGLIWLMDRLLHVLGVVVAARAERHGPSVFTGVRCGCGARWLLHLLVSHVRIDHR